jgi:hypothetical protein
MAGVDGSEDATLDLIGAIYDVALDATLWPDILNRIGDAVGAPRVMFGFYDGATGQSAIHAPRFDPEMVRSCVEWDPHNPSPASALEDGPATCSRSPILSRWTISGPRPFFANDGARTV